MRWARCFERCVEFAAPNASFFSRHFNGLLKDLTATDKSVSGRGDVIGLDNDACPRCEPDFWRMQGTNSKLVVRSF